LNDVNDKSKDKFVPMLNQVPCQEDIWMRDQCHALAALIPPSIHWTGGWLGSRVSLDAVAKIKKNSFIAPF